MNHKHSTYALGVIIFIIGMTVITSALNSKDIDEVCDQDETLLYRSNGTWTCGSLDFSGFNITYNYNSTNYTYINLNETDPYYFSNPNSYISSISVEEQYLNLNGTNSPVTGNVTFNKSIKVLNVIEHNSTSTYMYWNEDGAMVVRLR